MEGTRIDGGVSEKDWGEVRGGHVIEGIDVIYNPTDAICNVEIITYERDGNDNAGGRDSELPDERFVAASLDQVICDDGGRGAPNTGPAAESFLR